MSRKSTQVVMSSPGSSWWQHKLLSPPQAFHILKQSKEELSLLTPSTLPEAVGLEGFNLPLLGQVKWEELKICAKDWLKNPKNLALCLWGSAVGISGAILFLVMVGLLDGQLHSKQERDTWFEINNQILNALFTMMCLYLHPQRCLHLVMLLRWHPQDITMLRQIYCKNGTYKPHEWVHMMVVVMLLHINCFAQYALCSLNWAFKRSERPPIGVGLCLAVAIGAPAAAGIYRILSPLSKDFYVDEDNEAQVNAEMLVHQIELGRTPSLRIGRAPHICCGSPAFAYRDGALVDEPLWKGGLFDCSQDPSVTILSTLCTFCVFGWNMERLGFGNRYVHVVTFILLCTAPFWILNLAAINIDDVRIRKGLGVSGILLSIFGLLYGGFWRMQLRRTYKLPQNKFCFSQPVLTDCVQWLFCPLCSLCQEVRTSEYYRIRDHTFYERRALSEASPFTPCSNGRSSRILKFGPEASSPVPYRNYSPSAFSLSLDSGTEHTSNNELNGDGLSRFSDSVKNSSLSVPAEQVMIDRKQNHHVIEEQSSPAIDLQNYSDGASLVTSAKSYKSCHQHTSSPGAASVDHVLHDRSNRL
ncbi:hypothetical protein KP509_33G026600 [Ceratopteris richardii]|nr:hypothetical protein KP509_33G026600 [Ceratopteris richardii]